MEIHSVRLITALLATVAATAAITNGCLVPVKSTRGDTAEDAAGRGFLAEAVVANWWRVSALAARRMIEQYGVPDEVRPEYLVWYAKGPWKRTVVRNMTPPYGPADDLGVVEQTIRYPLTPGQVVGLRSFDRRLTYERGARELGARSDREEVNFLRVNLADDIINNRLTPEQASGVRARMLSLENAGKSSPYLQGLRFSPDTK